MENKNNRKKSSLKQFTTAIEVSSILPNQQISELFPKKIHTPSIFLKNSKLNINSDSKDKHNLTTKMTIKKINYKPFKDLRLTHTDYPSLDNSEEIKIIKELTLKHHNRLNSVKC